MGLLGWFTADGQGQHPNCVPVSVPTASAPLFGYLEAPFDSKLQHRPFLPRKYSVFVGVRLSQQASALSCHLSSCSRVWMPLIHSS